MEQILGLIFIQQLQQGLKAPMGPVQPIPHAVGRRMGDHNIHTTRPPERKAQAADAAAHLSFGVLIRTGMIAAAAAQAQNTKAIILHDPVIDAVAALRGMVQVGGIVVAGDIQHRAAGHGDQKLQIVIIQIAAGDDEIILCQTAGLIAAPQRLLLFIGHGKNPHSKPSLFTGSCSR